MPVPAYQQLNENPRLAERVHEVMVMGVSTRRYAKVLPETAGTVGISKQRLAPAHQRRSDGAHRADEAAIR